VWLHLAGEKGDATRAMPQLLQKGHCSGTPTEVRVRHLSPLDDDLRGRPRGPDLCAALSLTINLRKMAFLGTSRGWMGGRRCMSITG
jgi:hypothetical protein